MEKENPINNILQTVVSEADKINATLNNLHAKFISQDSTIPNKITEALKSLEHALEIIVRNTDIHSNKVNPEIFTDIQQAEVTNQLQKIGLLSRRIDREIRDHYRTIDNK
jgi:hypothetical protein